MTFSLRVSQSRDITIATSLSFTNLVDVIQPLFP
jgi:hypothetical protein